MKKYLALFLTLAGCSSEPEMPQPLHFTPLSFIEGERVQIVLDRVLDNYFMKAEQYSGEQGKISISEAMILTNKHVPDRVVRFEHPKLCRDQDCPFVVLIQNETYTSEIDRWNLEVMANGSSFAVGDVNIQGYNDLYVVNKGGFPRYFWDTDDQYYAHDGQFKIDLTKER